MPTKNVNEIRDLAMQIIAKRLLKKKKTDIEALEIKMQSQNS